MTAARFDGLGVVPQLVVSAGQRGKPDEQARIAGAKSDALFRLLDRLFRADRAIEVHLAEQNVGRRQSSD